MARKVEVLLFAGMRELIGEPYLTVELPDAAHVRDLKEAIVRAFPNCAALVQRSAFSINHEYAADDAAVPDSATVACIPPVSGG